MNAESKHNTFSYLNNSFLFPYQSIFIHLIKIFIIRSIFFPRLFNPKRYKSLLYQKHISYITHQSQVLRITPPRVFFTKLSCLFTERTLLPLQMGGRPCSLRNHLTKMKSLISARQRLSFVPLLYHIQDPRPLLGVTPRIPHLILNRGVGVRSQLLFIQG